MKTEDIKSMALALAEVNAKGKKKLDDVDKTDAKGDFDDRDDKDIDNDGKVTSSDEYLHKRRNKITKSSGGKKSETDVETQVQEDVEELDELSNKTLGSYVGRAARYGDRNSIKADPEYKRKKKFVKKFKPADGKSTGNDTIDKMRGDYKKDIKQMKNRSDNRQIGIQRAARRIAKEDVEHIDELSRKTLGSYIKKATSDQIGNTLDTTNASKESDRKRGASRLSRRFKGINKAADKLAKESFVDRYLNKVNEGKMSKAHKAIAHDVHKTYARDEPMSQAAGTKVKADHKMLQSKYGSDWRKKAGISEMSGQESVDKVPAQPADSIQTPKEIKQSVETSATPDTSKLDRKDKPKASDGVHAIKHNDNAENKSQAKATSTQTDDVNRQPANANESYVSKAASPETRTPLSMRDALGMMEDRAAHYRGATPAQEPDDTWSGNAKTFADIHKVATPPESDVNQAIAHNQKEVSASLRRSVDYRHNDNSMGDKKPVGNDDK